MKKLFELIVNELLIEQEGDIIGTESVYTPEQQKFLAHFGKSGNDSLGILYSRSDIGIQEFINRNGAIYNATPDVIASLLKSNVISIIPYTGYSRNTDYTIKCNVPLETLTAFSINDEPNDDKSDTPTDTTVPDSEISGGGGGMTTADLETGDIDSDDTGEGDAELPDTGEDVADNELQEIPDEGPEESFSKTGNLIYEMSYDVHSHFTYPEILKESAHIAKKLLSEQNKSISFRKRASKSRVLKRLPSGYLIMLEKIIKNLSNKIHNTIDKEHLVADILDNLAHNFGLTPNQILRSYTFYKNQNKLRNLIKK